MRLALALDIACSRSMGASIPIPPYQSELAGWWRPDDGITIATGVSQWNDRTVNGRNLLQANPAKQPLFVASAVNGHPAVRCDAVDDFMQALYTLAQPVTLVIAYKSYGGPGVQNINDAPWDGGAFVAMTAISNAAPEFYIYAGNALPAAGSLAIRVADDTYAIVTAIYNGASSKLRINGVELASGNAGATTTAGLTIGAFADGTRPTNVEVSDIMLYSRVLTAPEIAEVEAYAAAWSAVTL